MIAKLASGTWGQKGQLGVRRGGKGVGSRGAANATDRRDLNVKQDSSVKASRRKEEREEAETETETEKEGKAKGVLKWFGSR